jgi:serine/threonine protein kinase
MEYCCGGDVLHGIQLLGQFSESDCRQIFYGVLQGVSYLHERNISHRDIKPDNILLDFEGRAKIADFGLSRQIVRNRLFETPCGSLEYCPPEILLGGNYDGKAADIWSLGILLYGMCAGRLPWISQNNSEVCREVVKGDFEMPACASGDVRRLLKKMLCGKPEERATVAELLNDEWFAEMEKLGKQRRLSESVSLTGPNIILTTSETALRAPWKTKIIVKPQIGCLRSESPPHVGELGTSRKVGTRAGFVRPQVSMGWLRMPRLILK